MVNSWNYIKLVTLNWSAKFFLVDASIIGQEPTFTITDTKLYVPVVTLSTQDNTKLLQLLKSGFKRTINWSKYQSKVTVQEQNRYLDFLIDPSFQGVNRLPVLSFKNKGGMVSYIRYYLRLVEIKGLLFYYRWTKSFQSTSKK